MFEKRFLYIFLACSVLLIGCSKGTEEKAASVDTSEPVIVSEKDGTSHTYFVESFLVNQRVDDTKFTFNAKLYPDVDVIDLR